jgi:hypothetical protein
MPRALLKLKEECMKSAKKTLLLPTLIMIASPALAQTMIHGAASGGTLDPISTQGPRPTPLTTISTTLFR